MADTTATFPGIHNENEFCSQHWIFTGDIRGTIARCREAVVSAGGAGAGARTPNEALRALARDSPAHVRPVLLSVSFFRRPRVGYASHFELRSDQWKS